MSWIVLIGLRVLPSSLGTKSELPYQNRKERVHWCSAEFLSHEKYFHKISHILQSGSSSIASLEWQVFWNAAFGVAMEIDQIDTCVQKKSIIPVYVHSTSALLPVCKIRVQHVWRFTQGGLTAPCSLQSSQPELSVSNNPGKHAIDV